MMRSVDYVPRVLSINEDELRTILRETIRETREHPLRPDGTYNYSMEAIVSMILKEYYEPGEGWRSRLFDT